MYVLKLIPIAFAKLSSHEIRVFRFFVGTVFTIAIAFAVNWPFAFIAPIFVAKFLGNKNSKLPFKKILSIFLIICTAFILGGIATRLLLPFPVVFILIMTLLIFWISYWNNSGGNELVITMLLVGFTAIPLLGQLHQDAAELFTVGFLFSCFVSLLTTMIMHEIIPDKVINNEKRSDKISVLPKKAVRVKFALLTTLMIMPVMVFFFSFNLTSSALILVFIALLAQKPDLVMGVKGSKALLIGNSVGGIIAIVMYNSLIIVPSFTSLILLFSLVVIVLGNKIFSDHPTAPLYAMALSTVIILVSSATMGNADADEKFYTRIIQIACACSYVILATIAAMPLIKKITHS